MIIRFKFIHMYGIIFAAAFISYMASVFFPIYALKLLASIVAIILLIIAFTKVDRTQLLLTLCFLMASVGLIIGKGIHPIELLSGSLDLLQIVLFIGMVPLVSAPVQPYLQDIQASIQWLGKRVHPEKACSYATYVLSNFISLATIPIGRAVFCHDGLSRQSQLIYGELIIRSFSLAVFSTPVGAVVAFTIDLTGTTWLSLLSVNFVIIGFGLVLNYYMVRKHSKALIGEQEEVSNVPGRMQGELAPAAEVDISSGSLSKHLRTLMKISIPFGVYFAVVIILNQSTSFGIIEMLLVSIPPFTFIWFVIQRLSTRQWWLSCKFQVMERTPSFFGQFAVLISGGIFMHLMELAGFKDHVDRFLAMFDMNWAAILFIPLIIVVIVMLSLLGVHQFIGFVFVGQLIDPQIIGIDLLVFANLLMFGSVTSLMISSFSAATMIMSNMLPGTTSNYFAKRNYKYAAILFAFTCLYLTVLNYVVF